MTTKQAIEFFGGVLKMAEVLECWHTTIYQWGEYPPRSRQREMELISKGKLKAEPRPHKPCPRCGK